MQNPSAGGNNTQSPSIGGNSTQNPSAGGNNGQDRFEGGIGTVINTFTDGSGTDTDTDPEPVSSGNAVAPPMPFYASPTPVPKTSVKVSPSPVLTPEMTLETVTEETELSAMTEMVTEETSEALTQETTQEETTGILGQDSAQKPSHRHLFPLFRKMGTVKMAVMIGLTALALALVSVGRLLLTDEQKSKPKNLRDSVWEDKTIVPDVNQDRR